MDFSLLYVINPHNIGSYRSGVFNAFKTFSIRAFMLCCFHLKALVYCAREAWDRSLLFKLGSHPLGATVSGTSCCPGSGTTVPGMEGSAGVVCSVAGTCSLSGISGTVGSAGCGVTAGVSSG